MNGCPAIEFAGVWKSFRRHTGLLLLRSHFKELLLGHWRHERFDAVDHVMTYFFSDVAGLDGFLSLSAALGGAGRKLPLLPHVERGVYGVHRRVAAARVKVGADVLPWWPARGVSLLLESPGAPPAELVEVEDVAGVWSMAALGVSPTLASAPPGQKSF